MKKLLNTFLFLAGTGLLGVSVYNTYFIGFSVNEYSISFDERKPIAKRFKASIVKKKEILDLAKKRKMNAHLNIKKEAPKKAAVVQKKYQANITDNLSLNVTEVFNSKKYKKVLRGEDISGKLVASNGIIESLELSTPDDEIVIEMSQLNGNMFSYYQDGEIYSGLFYQIQNSSYMITLSNGPHAGTRIKLQKERNNFENINDEIAQNVEYKQGFNFN
jgi:hypothetical protein